MATDITPKKKVCVSTEDFLKLYHEMTTPTRLYTRLCYAYAVSRICPVAVSSQVYKKAVKEFGSVYVRSRLEDESDYWKKRHEKFNT